MPDRMINATLVLFTMTIPESSSAGASDESTIVGQIISKIAHIRLASASSRRAAWLVDKFSKREVEFSQSPLVSIEPTGKSGFVSNLVESILDWKIGAAEIEINLEIESLGAGVAGLKNNEERERIVSFPNYIIVADTLVEDPDDTNLALGQPTDLSNAASMLLRLSGRRHLVWSGTAVLQPDLELGWSSPYVVAKSVESATVEIDELTDLNLQELLESGSWKGKAGGYDLAGEMRDYAHLVAGEEVTVLGFAPTAIRKLESRIID